MVPLWKRQRDPSFDVTTWLGLYSQAAPYAAGEQVYGLRFVGDSRDGKGLLSIHQSDRIYRF